MPLQGSLRSPKPHYRQTPQHHGSLWNGAQYGLSGGCSGRPTGSSFSCQPGCRELVWILFPFSPLLPGSSGYILCSAMRVDTFKPDFRGQCSCPPCMESPYCNIMTPLYPRLLLGAATNPFGRKEIQFWSPGLSFGPGLAVDSVPQAGFRGMALCPPGVTESSHHCPTPAQPGKDLSPFYRWWRWGRGQARNRPRVTAGSLSGKPDTRTTLTLPPPSLPHTPPPR